MKPWGRRHPVATWILAGVSVLFLFARPHGWIIVGLLGLVGAYLLIGHPAIRWGTPTPRRSTVPAGQQGPKIYPAPSAPRRAGADRRGNADAMNRFNALPARTRIAIVNHLEPDEAPELVVVGANQDAVIGTDRRLFLVPEGRHGYEKMWSVPYQRIRTAGIEQERGGAHLFFSPQPPATDVLPRVRLSGDDQVEVGIAAVQDIRRRIAAAQQSETEVMSPADQSAFAATAQQPLPTSRSQPSLSLGDLLTMTPTEFEEFVGKALASMGYTQVNRVGGSGDLGADLTATDPQGRSAIVQCKRYTPGAKIGSPVLQSFIGMKEVHHKVDRGIFVTTADYSQQAIDLAREHDIVLIDGDDLVKIAALVLTPAGQQRAPQPSSTVRFCPNCGTGVREGMKFCATCGSNLAAS